MILWYAVKLYLIPGTAGMFIIAGKFFFSRVFLKQYPVIFSSQTWAEKPHEERHCLIYLEHSCIDLWSSVIYYLPTAISVFIRQAVPRGPWKCCLFQQVRPGEEMSDLVQYFEQWHNTSSECSFSVLGQPSRGEVCAMCYILEVKPKSWKQE